MDGYDIDLQNDPWLEAVFQLALKAHDGQYRRSGNRAYIHHPICVYEIMLAFGATREQLAIALLHDAVEDNKVYEANPLKLTDDVLAALKARIPENDAEQLMAAYRFAGDVSEGVFQLTNPIRYEGKRTMQARHAQMLHDSLKPIKIADQIASIIDGILYSPEGDLDKEKGFAAKALEVSRACHVDGSALHHALFKEVNEYFLEYHRMVKSGAIDTDHPVMTEAMQQSRDDAQIMRESFHLPILIEQARQRARSGRPAKQEVVFHHYDNDEDHYRKGIVRISLTKKGGNVCSFGMVVDPDAVDDPVNDLVIQFRDALEELPKSRVTTRDLETGYEFVHELGLEEHPGQVFIRDFRVKPVVPLERFLKIAEKYYPLKETQEVDGQRTTLVRGAPAIAPEFSAHMRQLLATRDYQNGRAVVGKDCPVFSLGGP